MEYENVFFLGFRLMGAWLLITRKMLAVDSIEEKD